MDSYAEAKEARYRRKSEGGTPETGPNPAGSIATQAPLPTDLREELTLLVQDLLLKCQELAFEYSTLETSHLVECPLADKCKDLFKTTKRIHEFIRKLAQAPQAA
jgi:hypothetical protein